MSAWWNKRPEWLRLSTYAALAGGIILLANVQSAAVALAPVMPVVWGQMVPYLDARADKRDVQMTALDARLLETMIVALANREDTLSEWQVGLSASLAEKPNDQTILQVQKDNQRSLDEVRAQRHLAECQLAVERQQTGASCVYGG